MNNSKMALDPHALHDPPYDCSTFSEFHLMTHMEVHNLMSGMYNASCTLDPQPTWLLKKHIAHYLPALTHIVNASFVTGVFPEDAHFVVIKPLLKKPTLDKEDRKNYRPVSNLAFNAKVIEKCVATQFINHLNDNNLMDPLQSAYRASHSTETALLKVQNDILREVDSNRVVLMVLLDLSSAFDTVDHATLLRLEKRFKVTGIAFKWFSSYLT